MNLYHFTCRDHGQPGIDLTGTIRPNYNPTLDAWLAWYTDLPDPPTDALGLSRRVRLTCDRMAVRYTITDHQAAAVHWPTWAKEHHVPRDVRDLLEEHAMPAHWWVSETALKVTGHAP